MSPSASGFRIWLIVAILLAAFAAMAGSSMIEKSATVDEPFHIASGYLSLIANNHRVESAHPPLIRMIAVAPLLVLRPDVPDIEAARKPGQVARFSGWEFARRFLFQNRVGADTLIFWARIPIIGLGVLLGLFVFYWARRLAGPLAGLVALTAYAFDPNVIAHSQLATTDLGVTLCAAVAVYAWIRYVHTPGRSTLVLAAAMFALAQVAKFTALVLFPVFVALAVFFHLREDRSSGAVLLRRYTGVVVTFALTTLLVVLCVYRFERQALIDEPSVSAALEQRLQSAPLALGLLRTVAHVPVPAYSYWKGLGIQVWHVQRGHRAYLLGERRPAGWWYYFPVAFIVKTPVATLLLLAVAGGLAVIRGVRRNGRAPLRSEEWMVLLAAGAIFGLSLLSSVNIGLRYILPVYPLLFVFVGAQVAATTGQLGNAGPLLRASVAALLAALAVSSVRIYPDYLAYFNEIAGGPENGWRFLAASNLDWGQDLRRLSRHLEAMKATDVYLAYSGPTPPEYYGIRASPIPNSDDVARTGIPRGVVAIGLTSLVFESPRWDWLLSREPVARIGHSIWVFDFRQERQP